MEINKQQAELLDKLLGILCKEPIPHRPTQPIYFEQLAEMLPVDKDILKQLLDDNSNLFHMRGAAFYMGTMHNFEVSATTEAKALYKSGFKYVNQLKKEEVVKGRRRIGGLLNWVLGIALAGLAAWGSVKDKIHDRKEERWENEKKELQTEIEKLTKQLDVIQDSLIQ